MDIIIIPISTKSTIICIVHIIHILSVHFTGTLHAATIPSFFCVYVSSARACAFHHTSTTIHPMPGLIIAAYYCRCAFVMHVSCLFSCVRSTYRV